MDEIEYKLKTNNSVLVVNAIEKLTTTVKSKFKPAERQKFILENEELKFLREKCSSKNTVVSLTACQGLLALVEAGVLQIGHTMSTVITLLPTAHNYSAIISTMAGLLILDLKSRLTPGQPYICQFSLRSPQHPFITVMEKKKEASADVLTQMQALCTHPDYIVSSNSLELLLPVFLWLSCHPHREFTPEVWQILLRVQNSRQPDLLLDCLSWQQTNNPKQTSATFGAYSAVTERMIYEQQREYVVAALPLLARLSNQLIRHGLDPRSCYHLMERCFTLELPEFKTAAGLTLAILAENLPNSCALHLHELLLLCLNIITRYEYPSISLAIFVSQSLQWLHLPSSLTTNGLKVASKIVETYRNQTKDDTRPNMPNLLANRTFQSLLYTDRTISIKFKLFQTWERIKDDPTKLRRWFDTIEKADSTVQLDLASFLLGVLLDKRKDSCYEEHALRALKIVVNLVDVKKELTVQLLPILLYKTANDVSPKMKLECLKALPLMAKTKENVPTIVSILNKLKTSNALPLSSLILLHTTLTETQVRCFPYLQELLAECNPKTHDVKWEMDVAKAFAVKKICENRPNQGLELVPVISSILNRCTDAAGTLASCQSLQALLPLWRQGLVAPKSAWEVLAPKLDRDRREEVQNSVCLLLEALPGVTGDGGVAWAGAWRRLAEGVAPQGACRALAAAATGPLKDVPEIYRKTIKLPPAYCKTPADAARNPEDVLDYIPCEVWPEVFKHTCPSGLPGVRLLATRLIEAETRAFRSGVYQEGPAPDQERALDLLPPSSVIRGLASFLRKQAISPTYDCPDSVLLEILHTLASPFPKPLPPFSLCFLPSLYHRGALWRRACVTLAARQANVARSAARQADNFLLATEPGVTEESDIIMIFELLPILARNMPPNSIRSPLEKCLSAAYNQIRSTLLQDVDPEQVEEVLFVKLITLVKVCLESDKIHDANRVLMSQIVENYWNEIGEDNVAWPSYKQACAALPSTNLERMTSPLSWWEISESVLRRSCAVRCEVALNSGLDWVSEIVDAAAACPNQQGYVLSCIMEVLVATSADDARHWLMQLMARTQVAFNETVEESIKSFLWDVFVLSVVVVSGHWSFEPDFHKLPSDRQLRSALFPAAVASLLQRESWEEFSPQVLECVNKSSRTKLPPGVAVSCRNALKSLRGNEHFCKELWARAISGHVIEYIN